MNSCDEKTLQTINIELTHAMKEKTKREKCHIETINTQNKTIDTMSTKMKTYQVKRVNQKIKRKNQQIKNRDAQILKLKTAAESTITGTLRKEIKQLKSQKRSMKHYYRTKGGKIVTINPLKSVVEKQKKRNSKTNT